MRNPESVLAALIAMSFVTVAHTQPVTQAWLDRYDGVGSGIDGGDRAFSVAFDSQGNTVIGGYSSEAQGGTYLAMKYAPDGTRMWTSTATPLGGLGLGWRMTLDNADNVIVVGSAGSFATETGIVKYGPAGNLLWSRVYPLGALTYSTFDAVVTDATGAIYSYANYGATATLPGDFVVVKYAADGTFLWDLVYLGGQATSIAVSDDGVYLSGYFRVGFRDDDLLVLKLTAAGAVDWAHTSGRTGEFAFDIAWDLAIDSAGNAVAAGLYNGIGGAPGVTTDFALVRLAPDGTVLSDTAYDGPLAVYNEARTIALDADDNAIVSGMLADSDGGYEIQTVKFDPLGNALWDRIYGSLPTFTDIPWDIAVDALGGAYVAGEIWGTGPVRRLATIKYDAAGALEWDQSYGVPYGDSYPAAVAVGPGLRVAVTGYSASLGPFGDDDVVTICYTQPAPVSAPVDGLAQETPLALRAAPNPFAGSTDLSLSLAETASIDLGVFDVVGRRVRTIADGPTAAGRHLLGWDGRDDQGVRVPGGMYFVRLESSAGQTSTRKLTILR